MSLATFLLMLALPACEQPVLPATSLEIVTVAGGNTSRQIDASPDSATLNGIGASLQLSATVWNRLGNIIGTPRVFWSSLQPLVAVVDATGQVTATGVGIAEIVATSGSAADTTFITVRQIPIATVSISPSTASLAAGDSVQLVATAADSNGIAVIGAQFTWTSSNPVVATVSGSGVVSAIATGSATITATAEDVSGTSQMTVTSSEASPNLWRMGYYPGWTQWRMPPSEIDWSALTHIAHFSLLPKADGTLDASANSLGVTHSKDVISRAHAAGVKVLVTVGSAGTQAGFLGATSDANRAKFVANIISHMTANGYDGVDIDWEPMSESDFSQFKAFVAELSAELAKLSPRPLLTAAVLQSDIYASMFAELQEHFDRINLMTYDMSGPWAGWVVWHNSPLYDGGYKFPTVNRILPSADLLVKQFVAKGVAKEKLGIGIAFYGKEWVGGEGTSTGGVTEPRQTWTKAPAMTSGEIKYWTIMDTHYDASKYRWDDVAKAPYLSFDNAGSSEDRFLSYENEESIKHKVEYGLREKIGGLIVWELSGGYFTTRPAGSRDPLLQAIKSAYQAGS